MKQVIKDFLKKAFTIQNAISRFFQFAIAIVLAITVCVLACNYGATELAQGFYGGAMFAFVLDKLNGVFRK